MINHKYIAMQLFMQDIRSTLKYPTFSEIGLKKISISEVYTEELSDLEL